MNIALIMDVCIHFGIFLHNYNIWIARMINKENWVKLLKL